jgi:hypothetical protein
VAPAGPAVGRNDAGIHHDGLDDYPGHLARVGVEYPGHRPQVVEADHQGQVHHGRRDPGAAGHPGGLIGRSALVGLGGHRDLHGIVVAVVATFDLDEQVAPGHGPHEMDGVHGRLGPRVVEAPQGQTEPSSQFLGHFDGHLRGLGEMGAPAHLTLHGVDHGRMTMAGQTGAVATVEIDVLVAVDVEDLGPRPVAQPHGLGGGDLPARGDAAGQCPRGPSAQFGRAGLTGHEGLSLPADEVVESARDGRGKDGFYGHDGLR